MTTRGIWLPGVVLWKLVDVGRVRVLVRYELPTGLTVRRLHWYEELRLRVRVLEIPLLQGLVTRTE